MRNKASHGMAEFKRPRMNLGALYSLAMLGWGANCASAAEYVPNRITYSAWSAYSSTGNLDDGNPFAANPISL